ncbi:MAG: DNA mismatch repair protein MutS [Deltaproteobacteria bacterium RBG_16_54_11]|nr:MAG: DNA mismatch repair protein MutS [Deltaproteobacteria bacterium RBG_16_54_11]
MQDHTPVIRQYLRIKGDYRDCILFFRMGDFYEMFFDDAKVASKILEIALTSREKGGKERIPLCGVPCHAAAPYITKLIDKGYKVAICEQVGDARASQGLVEREVTQVITPGMVVEGANLQEKENNFLMSLYRGEGGYGLVFLDLSTGEFKGCRIADKDLLMGEVVKNRPREALIPEGLQGEEGLLADLTREFPSMLVNTLPDPSFRPEADAGPREELIKDLIPSSAGAETRRAALAAFRYCQETQQADVGHIKPLFCYRLEDYLILDETTQRNLELFASQGGRGKKGTVLDIVDETITAMGGRRIRAWLSYPLVDCREIEGRLEAVAELKETPLVRADLRELMEEVYDLERLNARVIMGKANPRDLVALKTTLKAIPAVKKGLADMAAPLLQEIRAGLDELDEVAAWIDDALVASPPITMTEGGIIKDGYSQELDELRGMSRAGKGWIARLEVQERQRTGISSLKVRYNQVFGYYIEVTRPNLDLVPEDYVRKQTLTNAERFITPQLKEYEDKVLGAEERIKTLEHELFRQLRERLAGENRRIQGTASAIGSLDALLSLAEVADKYRYNRPRITDKDEIVITSGRHPVVERMGHLEPFVPNDARLDGSDNQLIIITGPNMAGKSTYIRQVALICLMAQMGGFVPAQEATIGLVDRIFTRVGASDNLARGESTFMVEMRETADILKEATPRSLVILDEIGRGTSTFDGLSIAWAVAEYLHDKKGPKTLFATHYHELTELAMTKPRVKNYNVAISEWNGEIIFLRRIVEGGTSRSYGIQVARLAGLPEEVVARAREVLANLEKGELDEKGMPRLASVKGGEKGQGVDQLDLFAQRDDRIYRELQKVDPNRLTPLEAVQLLYHWKKMMEEGD